VRVSPGKMPVICQGCSLFPAGPPERASLDDVEENFAVLGRYRADVLSAGIDRFLRRRTFTPGLAGGLAPHQTAIGANVATGPVVGAVGTGAAPAERPRGAVLDGVKRKGNTAIHPLFLSLLSRVDCSRTVRIQAR
jgi:hypothetical protein